LEFLEKKRAEGLEITTDLHPYDSIMTDMQMLLPPWVFNGGKMKTLERLRDPETREKIKHDQIHGCEGWDEWYPIDEVIGWENILPIMLKSEKYKGLEGKNLKEIAELDEKDLFNAIYDVLIEEEADASMIITHLRGEEDIINFIKSPLAAFETDTSPTAPYGKLSQANTHPRGYGTYPKFLGEFVREKKVISLEEAIRKSTSFPAQIAGILDRGILRPGFWADIAIFNPDTIKDTGSYANPHQYPIGIEYVLVNGEIVVQKGEHTGKLPGKVLRHTR
jgi:N-acyl-D-amino-acid deacylase